MSTNAPAPKGATGILAAYKKMHELRARAVRTPDQLKQLPPQERRVQIAAARLRESLDERLDRPTPPEVEALAREPF